MAHVGSEATEITVGNMEVFLRLALVGLYATDSNILFLVYQALSTLCPRVKNASPMLAVLVSEVLRSMPRDEGGLIAGLRYPRMVEPIVTMYLDFVLFKDDPSVRTAMVKALGDMCGMAPVENLKSFAKKIIAPLVRLTTGSQQVHRLTLLYSLYHVVGAFGDMIGTFAPQIQPAAMRGLADPEDGVPQAAACLLVRLAPTQRVKRLETLIKALCSEIKKAESHRSQVIYLRTLSSVLDHCDSRAITMETKLKIKDAVWKHMFAMPPVERAFAAEAFSHVMLDVLDQRKEEEKFENMLFCNQKYDEEYVYNLYPSSRIKALTHLIEVRWDQLVEMFPPPQIYDELWKELDTNSDGGEANLPRARIQLAGVLMRLSLERDDAEFMKIARQLMLDNIMGKVMTHPDLGEVFRSLRRQVVFMPRKSFEVMDNLVEMAIKVTGRLKTEPFYNLLGEMLAEAFGFDGTDEDDKRFEAWKERAPKRIVNSGSRMVRKWALPNAKREPYLEPFLNFSHAYV